MVSTFKSFIRGSSYALSLFVLILSVTLPMFMANASAASTFFEDDFSGNNGDLLSEHDNNWEFKPDWGGHLEGIVVDNTLQTQNGEEYTYFLPALENTGETQCSSFEFFGISPDAEWNANISVRVDSTATYGEQFIVQHYNGAQASDEINWILANWDSQNDPVQLIDTITTAGQANGVWRTIELCTLGDQSYGLIDGELIAVRDIVSPVMQGSVSIDVQGDVMLRNFTFTDYPVTGSLPNDNAAPIVGAISAPAAPIQINSSFSVSASFSDIDSEDTHTATWDWGDGTSSQGTVGINTVSGGHLYVSQGVYIITLTVADDSNAIGSSEFRYLVAYSPSSAKVSGSRNFNSPAGALIDNPTATGSAKFGFNTAFVNNQTTGNAKFMFEDIDFTSSSINWVVVTGQKIQIEGIGSILGRSGQYKIYISALDTADPGENIDTVRVIISESDTNNVIYDSQVGASQVADPTAIIIKGDVQIK